MCKRYKFSAAHHLPGHDSLCAGVHGHTFFADIYARGDVQTQGPERGMVVDYSVLSKAWKEIEPLYDHADLNGWIEYPTTERVAHVILSHMRRAVPQVFKVKLWEGPQQFVEVSVDN